MHRKKLRFYTILVLFILWCSVLPGVAATRLSVVVSSESEQYQEMLSGLQLSLDEAGRAVDLDVYHLDNELIKAELVVEKIKAVQPDIVVTFGAMAFDTVADTVDTIPIIAGMILSQEKIQGRSNATGVALEIPIDIQFAFLKKIFPWVKNVGVLYSPQENRKFIQKARAFAKHMGLNLVAQAVSSPQELPSVLKTMNGTIDVLWGINDRSVLNQKTAKNILLFSFRNKIPFIGLSDAWTKAGAVYALDRNYNDLGIQCGEMALEVMDGVTVETIEPVGPRRVFYSLNMRMVERMNLHIEQSIIHGAEKTF